MMKKMLLIALRPGTAKKLTALFLAFLFLGGSLILPLGDFSLMRDLPAMYRSYARIASPDERGVIDFVGDYLLHGRDLLGHNRHDKSESSANGIQFQHTSNHSNIVVASFQVFKPVYSTVERIAPSYRKHSMPAGYLPGVFRPPVAAA
ncbi:MAG: hypothetical protein JST19_18170 [Bacteroidetes bacterium]|nr:hypothetical protein [Bacteroidota bacterium]